MNKRSTLDGAAKHRLSKLIEEHCHPIGDPADRQCAYDDGWDDQTIADQFGCTRNNVYGQRKLLMGVLATPPAPPPPPGLEDRVNLLTERFNALILHLGGMDLFATPDVSHLEIKP